MGDRVVSSKKKDKSIRSENLITAKNIAKRLEQTILHDDEMAYGLYEHELEELLDELKASFHKDKDDYIFVVTKNTGDVAMVLIEKSCQVHINEQAKERQTGFLFEK